MSEPGALHRGVSEGAAQADATARVEATARESTRGVAVIALAKAWFMLTGFAQPIVLTRVLGIEGYGLWAVVLNVVSILNNVVVQGSIQAMSRAVTEDGAAALRRGLLLHAALGATLAGTLAASADWLGTTVLQDPRLPPLLRLGAIIVADYSIYAALVGALNGRRRFRAQASLDITFATMRTLLVIGGAMTPWRVAGAVGGFALASMVIVAAALGLNRRELAEKQASGASAGAFALRYARFFAPVLVYQLALNLVFQADLLVLKGVLGRRADATPEGINALTGIYKGVQNFAFLPYQLMLAVTFVVFPVVSQATLAGDRATASAFVRGAMRFSALGLGAMLAVLAGMPRAVLHLAYRPPFEAGAPALRVLSLAQGALALAVIGTTMILAAGRTGVATALMGVTLAGVLGGDFAGLAGTAADSGALLRVATGTFAGCLLGLAAVGVYIRREFGGFLDLSTALRAAACAGAAGFAGAVIPWPGKVGTLAGAAFTAGLYAVLLVLGGELRSAEIARIRRVLTRS